MTVNTKYGQTRNIMARVEQGVLKLGIDEILWGNIKSQGEKPG